MQIDLGLKLPSTDALVWDPATLINPHLIVAGDTGSGKTANLRHWCEQLARQGRASGLERVHVFDSHGDIDVPASKVRFSQASEWGYNPLEMDPDRDFGGPRRAVANFIGLLQRSSRRLGPIQESVLRTLLYEAFEWRGFRLDDPSSWRVDSNEAQPCSSKIDGKRRSCGSIKTFTPSTARSRPTPRCFGPPKRRSIA